MRKRVVLIILVSLLALTGCNSNHETAFDWDNHTGIDYTIGYSVRFEADHDSTMQLTATSNYGTVRVNSNTNCKLADAEGNPVKNTFIVLEDSVPEGKSITMDRGALSYGGGKPDFIHVQTVGSDDLVEISVLDTDALTHSRTNALSTTHYSIRDNMFYGPDDQQPFTIPAGHRFSVVLPVMTEERFPREVENHSIRMGLEIANK